MARITGAILFLIACIPLQGIHPWIPLFFSILFLAMAACLDYRYWRCPHCHHHLGRRMFPFPTFCGHCQQTVHKTDRSWSKKQYKAELHQYIAQKNVSTKEETLQDEETQHESDPFSG
ncbi:hypothetical protein [Murdochiella vaginalis]|uniref:hypothetical protein n=1 Tax=Murdochiella vaginalis TaxID=1852373 RepID=UPI0011CA6CA9|nr:hypothetical protein [Murdochiella vaginalis]